MSRNVISHLSVKLAAFYLTISGVDNSDHKKVSRF